MQDDRLIREYVQKGSQAAFTQIVERYLNLVYSACLREMGDAQLAEDATQIVFLVLSRRAASLRASTVLSGWLFTIARLTCSNLRRQERRRTHYEARAAKEAGMLKETQEAAWMEIEPLLQDAIASLRPPDRDAILLRFFQGYSMLETGDALGLSEDAARKRVSRAVEKLRTHFTRHGVVVPAILLSAMLADHAVSAAPINAALVSQTVSKAVLYGAAGSSITSASQGVLKMIWLGRIKAFAVATACIAGSGAAVIAVGTAVHKKPAVAAPGKPAVVKLAAASFEEPATDIDGIVLKPDGSPAAGAKVWWSDITNFDDRPPSISTLTNAKGEFHFDAKIAWSNKPSRNVGESRFGYAIAQMDGFGISGNSNRLTGALVSTPGAPIIIDLTPAATLQARCVDDQGKPVPHVRIYVDAFLKSGNGVMKYFDVPKDLPGTWSAESDAGGQVAFTGLPQGWDTQLETDDSRFVRLGATYPNGRYTLDSATVIAKAPLKLISSATIEGTITFSPSGSPAPGVLVIVSASGPSNSDGGARTDNHGHYKIDRMQAGKYDVRTILEEPLNEDWTGTHRGGYAISPGIKLTNVDLTVVKGALITGHIIRAGTGKPAARIRVFTISETGRQVYQDYTDEEGNFRFRTAPGDISVSALRQQGAPEHVTVPDGGQATINMITNAEQEPDGLVATAYHGVVVDAGGNPAPYSEVVATGMRGGEPAVLHSDRNGRFTISARGSPLVLLRARLGDAATPEPVSANAGSVAKLQLRNHTLVEIEGRVEDPGGHPIAGAKMIAMVKDVGENRSIDGVSTDSRGLYRFTGLWPGKQYNVQAFAPGFGLSKIIAPGESPDDDLTPAPGETAKAKTIVLTPANGAVAGHIVDSHGTPLAGATVAVGINGPPTTATDKNGYFRLEGLAPGDIGLAVQSEKEIGSAVVHTGKMDALVRTRGQAQEQQWSQFAEHQMDMHIGKRAPELPPDGWANTSPVSMSDLKGKYIVFDIFGCCVDNMFTTQAMVRSLAGQGVVGIGLDQENDTKEALNQHATKEHLTLPLLLDSHGSIARSLGSPGIEGYVLVSRDGKIVAAGNNLDRISETLTNRLAAERKTK